MYVTKRKQGSQHQDERHTRVYFPFSLQMLFLLPSFFGDYFGYSFAFCCFFSGLVTKFLAISDKNIPIYTYLRICTYIYGNWMWLCMCVCGLMYPCAYVCVNNPAAFVVKSPDKNLFLLVFFLYVFFEMQFFGGFMFLLDKNQPSGLRVPGNNTWGEVYRFF